MPAATSKPAPRPRESARPRGVAAEAPRGDERPRAELPEVASFADFLRDHARAKAGSTYVPYTTEGREVLGEIVALIDQILGSNGGRPLTDATLAICGGAQWGKTVLVLNLFAYLLAGRFLSAAYYLPDDDLVEAIVDGKWRPDVVEQIPWLATLVTTGRTLTRTGRQVNRKGALLCTDGKRMALGYMIGLSKPPTAISADLVIVDERDDIKERHAKFLRGRLTSSALRLLVSIGTMRVHGAGQNRQFREGTQHTIRIAPFGADAATSPAALCPEDHWPAVCRMAVDGEPRRTDPKLGPEGDFRDAAGHVFLHDLDARYYLAHPLTGAPLDRDRPRLVAAFPERARQRRWSVRVSQLGMSAIPLVQIVADWCDHAVRDPEAMMAFRCDRLARPANASQALSPEILARARRADLALSLAPPAAPGAARFAGLDMGDRCWLVCRERHGDHEASVRWLEQIALGRVPERVPELFAALGISCLFVDARPDAATSRALVMRLNGLLGVPAPRVLDPQRAYIQFNDHLAWDGPNQRWKGLRAAVVEFALRDGQGIRHVLKVTEDGLMFPCIQVNRDEAIQGAVNELLTPAEGVAEVIGGAVRSEPFLRLPAITADSPRALQVFEEHCLAGSQKETDAQGVAHFVDKIENHYLLAGAYARLAERIGGRSREHAPFAAEAVEISGAGHRHYGEGALL